MSKEELLVLLIEECGEVIQAATKCLRFGWDRDQIGYGVNHKVLAHEVGDVLGIIDNLDLREDIISIARENKIAKAIALREYVLNE